MGRNKTNRNSLKRKKDEESEDSDTNQQSTAPNQSTATNLNNFSRFVVMTSVEDTRTLSSLSPFVIEKSIQSIAGHPKSIKKLKSGDLLIEVEKEQQLKNLLKTTKLFDLAVKASLHNTLNSCKGVIRSPDLGPCTDEEIIDHLKDQGVTDVRNISVRRGGAIRRTNTYVLTFDTPVLPQKLKVAYLSVNVEVYIPNPLRCYRCQVFGHHESRCTKKPLCPNCGEEKHVNNHQNCENEAKCVNCGGKHPVFSRECSAWKKEKEILTVKYQKSITFPEARKIVEERYPTGTTYASIAKGAGVQVKSYGTQTVESCIAELKKAGAWSKSSPAPSTSATSKDTTQVTSDRSTSTDPKPSDRSVSTEPKPAPHVKEKPTSNRVQKGSEDQIQTHNRYGSFSEDDFMEAEDAPPSPHKGKITRVPIPQ
ncbi:MAG: hypothetical protein N0E45_09510 [Candidatus Thiodiazotropha endolucinida]|nr:hypothetical protein [Candidatus Thiodiazotropha taylori]MCW4299884.1 hypothetical protein [Candidatus Thiodiazotropha endolucinida]